MPAIVHPTSREKSSLLLVELLTFMILPVITLPCDKIQGGDISKDIMDFYGNN